MAGISGFEWIRVTDDFNNYTLKGDDGITPADINQGYIGNCWWMAAVSALAEKPNRVDDALINDHLSENGIYAVKMYLLGTEFI